MTSHWTSHDNFHQAGSIFRYSHQHLKMHALPYNYGGQLSEAGSKPAYVEK